jgi:hypothetical protein
MLAYEGKQKEEKQPPAVHSKGEAGISIIRVGVGESGD